MPRLRVGFSRKCTVSVWNFEKRRVFAPQRAGFFKEGWKIYEKMHFKGMIFTTFFVFIRARQPFALHIMTKLLGTSVLLSIEKFAEKVLNSNILCIRENCHISLVRQWIFELFRISYSLYQTLTAGRFFLFLKKSFRVRVCNVEAISLSHNYSTNGVVRAEENLEAFIVYESHFVFRNNQLENCFLLHVS